MWAANKIVAFTPSQVVKGQFCSGSFIFHLLALRDCGFIWLQGVRMLSFLLVVHNGGGQ